MYTKEKIGQEHVNIDLGLRAWSKGLPNVYTAYNVLLKFELKTLHNVRKVGISNLTFLAVRMLNKRTLPNLRPGENVLQVTANRMAAGLGLELVIEYGVNGQLREVTQFIRRFPYYFRINVANVPEEVRENYDQDFNQGRLQMVAIGMRLRPVEGRVGWTSGSVHWHGTDAEVHPATAAAGQDDSLDQRAALAAFARSYPHPADFTHRQPAERRSATSARPPASFRRATKSANPGYRVPATRRCRLSFATCARAAPSGGGRRPKTSAPFPKPSMSSWRNSPKPTAT